MMLRRKQASGDVTFKKLFKAEMKATLEKQTRPKKEKYMV